MKKILLVALGGYLWRKFSRRSGEEAPLRSQYR